MIHEIMERDRKFMKRMLRSWGIDQDVSRQRRDDDIPRHFGVVLVSRNHPASRVRLPKLSPVLAVEGMQLPI